MNRNAVLGALVLAAALTTGCVDRKFVITSDPPAAAVYRNGVYIGQTPVDDSFVYYGKYEFKLVHEGYETVVEQKRVASPWYEFPPLDFITDNFAPDIHDVRRLHYTLPERAPVREPDVLQRAQELQTRAASIGVPSVDGNLPRSAVMPGPVAPSTATTTQPAPVAPPVTFPPAPARTQ